MDCRRLIGASTLALVVACASESSDDPQQTGSSSGTQSDDSATSDETSNETPGGSTTANPTTGTTADPSSTAGGGSSGEVDTEPGPDFRSAGPYTFTTTTGEEALASGCTMGYSTLTPEGLDTSPLVFLGHGFQSTRASMVGWAEHWASWGLTVVIPDLCHSQVFDAQHPKNGTDMLALRDALGLGETLWVGHSAGGLSAIVAASMDPTAVAVLGLDMTDGDSEGLNAAPGVSVPGYNLVGEPDQCNAEGNGIGAFSAMPNNRVVRLNEADHCDFQSPEDPICSVCAQPNSSVTPEDINGAVLGMSTGFLLWQGGIDSTGQQWWRPGLPYFDELDAAGVLTDLL